MREILFRGQTRKKGQKVNMAGEKLPGIWVYGGIFPGTGDYSIIYGGSGEKLDGLDIEKHIVYSDTVGQFTGLTDKNGKKIFEGDIITYLTPENVKATGTVRFDEYGSWGLYAIGFFINWVDRDGAGWLRQDIGFWAKCREIVIIGNIYDNPELLEVHKNEPV